MILRDNRTVTPGVLLRQPFEDSDIGSLKADALARRLKRICPEIELEASSRSLLDEPLGGPDWVAGVELVIEATASTAVMSLLERRRWGSGIGAVTIVSMAIGHRADRGMVVVSLPAHSGGPLDVCRRLKLAACDGTHPDGFLDEFWPAAGHPIFQPEPGCSDATFVGSSADVAGLAALMLNRAAVDLATTPRGATATGHFPAQPHVVPGGLGTSWSSSFTADLISEDIHAGYQIRISPTAWSEIRSWIVRGAEAKGRRVETGGILFGERDEATGVIWVSEVSGPPTDSSASPRGFVCGIAGTAELNAEKSARTRGSVRYVGMWHTHPESYPLPSATDWEGMRRLVREAGGASRCLLLIVGCPHDRPMLGTYVFRAADFQLEFGMVDVRDCVVRSVEWDDPEQDGE